MGRIRLKEVLPPGRMVEASGSRFHIHETGAGKTTVILEAGIAATSISWALVQPEVAEFARVISYDRAGLGWSDRATTLRTPQNIARELHALLKAAGLPPPYVLVGHSFGGLIVERFAIEYPDEVAGLVLADALSPAEFWPRSEHQRHRLRRAVSLSRRGALLARAGVVSACLSLALGGNQFVPKLAARLSSGKGGSGITSRLAGEIGKLPRELWPAIAWHWSLPKSFDGMASYLESLPESCREMTGAQLPEVPAVVISAAGNRRGPGIGLSHTARFVTAERSGHWVQLDEPQIVIEAIRTLIR